MTDEKCADFTGFFQTLSEGADCNTYRATLPPAVCISQSGCDLTVQTGSQVLTGKAVGLNFTVSAPTPVRTECTGTMSDDGLQVKCSSFVPLAREPYTCDFPTVRREGTEETSYCCNPMASNCGAGERCNLVALVSNRDPLAAVCLPLKGEVGVEESCQRFGPESMNAGNDDCAAGLFCSFVSLPSNGGRVCRQLCAKQSDCDEGRICYGITDVPVAGFCIPTCDIFGDQCAPGTTCRFMGALDNSGADVRQPACSTTGSVAVGGVCNSDNDCIAGTACSYQPGDRNLKCRALCDADHPCGGNVRCAPFDAASGDTTGVCATR